MEAVAATHVVDAQVGPILSSVGFADAAVGAEQDKTQVLYCAGLIGHTLCGWGGRHATLSERRGHWAAARRQHPHAGPASLPGWSGLAPNTRRGASRDVGSVDAPTKVWLTSRGMLL